MEKEVNSLTKADLRKGKRHKYDARGVQTLFKTLSRNHYNLLKMVDNKARIVLTVNSIITSLLLGIRFINTGTGELNINTGTKILVISSMLSMIFALLCMLPHRYFGKKYRKSGYKGTLYAENFSSLSLDEFKQEFERIMVSGQSVYDEMVTDLYFLGKIISMKQKLVTISVGIFLLGLIATIIYTLSTTI
ncbi:Pycsar system effector family protein [Arenibacter echinorum]|uniref:Pycsar effector protein domain-containing protein n=1 Tax=Arenibacter echinorum TaxID=440515 RepID=A0A327RK17_9FLAO|nr:Pycsar system effector family protein [Arenibacter echinorum]RAJ14057.1 hypothetical protein LV92_01174 [Arenibacter echinorum]